MLLVEVGGITLLLFWELSCMVNWRNPIKDGSERVLMLIELKFGLMDKIIVQ